MSRVLPAPLFSALLFVVWLLLNGTVSIGHCVLGALLALAIPWFTDALRADKPRLRRPLVALRLGAVVLLDIVRSNIEVARRILGPQAAIRPGFVWVPLTLTDPHAIVTLAAIVTMTPGTLSADLSEDCRHLLVHALHLDDEAALIESIRLRYEAPLRQIFEAEEQS
jgi:multicomponent K+:H+ antiporter subunit E